MGTIASSNAQEKKKKKKFPQCLVAYTATRFFSVLSFPFLMNPLHSLFFTNLLSPHKTLPLPPSQFHSWKQSWFFFFFWVKNSCRALHCHRAMVAPFFFFSFFSSLFFFFLVVKKKFPRSSHCWKEIFAWNYLEHWCEFNIWQNVMVEASTMVIWCCESVMFLFFL